ncbi:MAG: efflux RND transporter periplasmic adaptor subunit [Bacteroidetes bacterium]|nr:efflux RND transporter periplasmic adaptor subunit [Bacteroidota bacterium]
MRNKNIIIGVLALALTAALLYILVFSPNSDDHMLVTADGQLYTCGMHPELILDEPGNCPICGMNLTPIRGNNQRTSGERKILYWRAPMNPNEVYDKPGKSRMGMDLVPIYEDEGSETGVVTIDGTTQQNMNLKTVAIKVRKLNAQVITNGILEIDERNEFVITTKVGGWVEKLYVNYTGQEVKKGEKLIDIYSPELVAAQQEYITALSYAASVMNSSDENIAASGKELTNNSIRKLELLDISSLEIERLRKTKEINKYVTLYAPFDGTVIHKQVTEGEKINSGSPLLRIADLRNLWLMADVYEYELSKIKVGSAADIRFNFLPGKIFKGKVSFIYPTLDSKTRTVKVRIDMPNYNNELKPSMFATIKIKGEDLGNYPVVPEDAIIRSGQNNIIILALGEGKFRPVDVKLGNYADGYYQVLDGLTDGNKIVTSAQFLIDSESNLRAALTKFTSSEESNDDMSDLKMDESTGDYNKETEELKSPLIRIGTIDLESIDENKDGKLYQDIMDWNVISDEPGSCPICGMKLREFTIDEVKANLNEHGFEYKN